MFQVRLEESIIDQHKGSSTLTEVHKGTPQSAMVRESISKGSRPDYVCYTLRAKNNLIVAVIIETKMTSHSSYRHSIAQVIGYYIALVSDEKSTPLVFVLSDKTMQLVMFPFVKGDEKLINAVKLPPIDLWLDSDPSSFSNDLMAILIMMLTLSSKDGLFSGIQYTFRDYVKKSAVVHVKTIANLLAEALKRVDEKDREIGEKDREIGEKDREIEEKDREIERLKELLGTI